MSASNGNNAAKRNDGSKEKCTSAERNFYMKPLLRLKHDQEILEKGFITAMENMKIKPDFLHSILREHRELSVNRQIFLDTMRNNITDIHSDLESVKIITKNPQEIQKLDVISYKKKLLKLSERMQDFENSCPLRTLMAAGDLLNSELRDSEVNLRKYDMVEKNAMLSSQSWGNKIEKKVGNVQDKDVNDFHALVAATGHTEHWTADDHRFFLKMREKCESIPALVAAIRKKFPDLSPEMIVNHDAWYKQYRKLCGKKKEAVVKWRQRQQQELKEKQKISRVECENETEYYQEKLDPLYKIEQVKEVNIRGTRGISKLGTRSTNSSASSNGSEKKELIRKWRMEKEKKRSMDEEQIKLQTKLKKEMEESRRRRRRERLQEALGEYKQRKTLENGLREQAEGSREKSKYSTTLIKAFREQDEEFTKKRKDLISRSKRPSRNDLLELKKVELVESRDYSTLMDPTKICRYSSDGVKGCRRKMLLGTTPVIIPSRVLHRLRNSLC